MDVDSPVAESDNPSYRDRIAQRLIFHGLPKELSHSQKGLLEFVRGDKSVAPQLVSSLLPSQEDMLSAIKQAAGAESHRLRRGPSVLDMFYESLVWIQWLMFEDEPQSFLKSMENDSFGQQGVCGTVWGAKDLAYRCLTCEHDPTCAICVSCFENGNHEGHDYSMIYTEGGCCDCGDVTAWKREGFCSRHKGTGQSKPIRKEVANSMGPILDTYFGFWKDKLVVLDSVRRVQRLNIKDKLFKKYANAFSLVTVEMLLDFYKHSESLLIFTSQRILLCHRLLDMLVRAELFVPNSIVRKVHELLLKLLGDPVFKYEFAKVLIHYYPIIVSKGLQDGNDSVLTNYPLLSTFSAQIFTVPTISLQLVKEANIFDMLLECLEDIFLSCIGEDGRFQPSKYVDLYGLAIHVIGDINYVLSQSEVQKYVFWEVLDIPKTWIRLTNLVQGMDPQKRVTDHYYEEESEHLDAGFLLGNSMTITHSLFCQGAFSAISFEDNKDAILLRNNENECLDKHTKPGRCSEESCVYSVLGEFNSLSYVSRVPSSAVWLILQCLKAIEKWLWVDGASRISLPSTSSYCRNNNHLESQKSLFKNGEVDHDSDSCHISSLTAMGEELNKQNQQFSSDTFIFAQFHRNKFRQSLKAAEDKCSSCSSYMDFDDYSGSLLEDTDSKIDSDAFRLFAMNEWPEFTYDVSSEEISFHIPLHRLLSLLLKKLLKACFGDNELLEMDNSLSQVCLLEFHQIFFNRILQDCHKNGFSAFIMEHPLRLRVFCAQVSSGMWQRNGEAATSICSWYHSCKLRFQGSDSDLFLLQCCAALAPPDLFVMRILERYGLSNYLSLDLERTNEYEPSLLQDMLTLFIQIVQERCHSGLSDAQYVRRELVCRLAVADATHSQLVKAMPDDLFNSGQLQGTLDRIAIYTKPSGLKQGRYSLRRECWKELDLYHPRWNSRDLLIAEERYERICNACASVTQLPRWTKIYYPLYTLSGIATCKAILQIVRVVLFYAYFSDNPSQSRAPDGVVLTTLHLLSLAIDVCHVHKLAVTTSSGETNLNVLQDGVIPIIAFAGEEIDVAHNMGTYSWKHQSMLSLLVSLMRKYENDNEHNILGESNCSFSLLIEMLLKRIAVLDSDCRNKLLSLAPDVITRVKELVLDKLPQKVYNSDERKAKARERQAAILEKIKMEQSKFIASLDATEDACFFALNSHVCETLDEQSQPVCSLCHDGDSKDPVSFLIFLQKSCLTSLAERKPPAWNGVGQSDLEHPCRTRSEIMNKNCSSSSATMSSSQLVNSVQVATNEFPHAGQPANINLSLDATKVRVPTNRNIEQLNMPVQSNTKTELPVEIMENDIFQSIKKAINFIEVKGKTLQSGLKVFDMDHGNASTNNGTVKVDVFGEYAMSISQELGKFPAASINCSGQSGCGFSINYLQDGPPNRFGPTDCDGIYISSCGHAVHQKCRDQYLSSLRQRSAQRVVFERGQILDPDKGEFLCPVCRQMANAVLPASCNNSNLMPITDVGGDPQSEHGYSSTIADLERESNAFRIEVALSLLQSAADQVVRNNIVKSPMPQIIHTRGTLEPIFHTLHQMYYPGKSDDVMGSKRVGSESLLLWDCLRYSLIATEIAARHCGMKSFLDNGMDVLHKEFEASSGFVLSLLLHVAQKTRSENRLDMLLRFGGIQLFSYVVTQCVSDDDVVGANSRDIFSGGCFPDIQFWRRAADPVLCHDPFSTLLWVLYCLPAPLLSSSDFLLPLVHLFYVVCVFQALITCCLNHHINISLEGLNYTVVNRVVEIIKGSKCAQQYFVSNFMDYSCNLKDMIRAFTHPYLRRCSLLWKLLSSSRLHPFGDLSYLWNKPSNNSICSMDELTVEEADIRELEHLFQIGSLEMIFGNNLVHSLALKWCDHFCKKFGLRNNGCVLHSTPSVPFRLILLPNVYQDLLQRYIKHRCSECKRAIGDVSLCLLCGRVCSPTWNICCSENDCQHHARSCGAGVGVFLLIKKTQILLIRSANQAYWPSVYLDAFGEEDPDMERGKPLYLNEERYAVLTHMVASHGLYQSSKAWRPLWDTQWVL